MICDVFMKSAAVYSYGAETSYLIGTGLLSNSRESDLFNRDDGVVGCRCHWIMRRQKDCGEWKLE